MDTRKNLMNPADTMPFSKLMGVTVTEASKEKVVGELTEGAGGTTTIESKTNFLGAAREGETVTAETTPVQIGKRLSVWQTRISRADGKAVALVTQTQLVL
jgi:1,4-dihydroxy-2-naphthoyl-CoA hydrolase